jgi:hypothetical protein
MSDLWIVLVGAITLVFLAILFFVVRPINQKQRIQVVVNNAGIPLTTEIEPMVTGTLRREVRLGFASVAVGVGVATAGMILAGVHARGAVLFIDASAVLLAIGIGGVIGSVAQEDARQKSQVRFARLRSVGISDYRAPLEQWLPRIVIILALAVFAFRVAVGTGGIAATPPFLFVYAAAMLISLAICEIASRALVRRGQPAGSALELAWDDALRSRALNSIALAPLYLGAYFNIASIAFYSNSRSAAAVLAVDLSAGVELLFALGLLLWAISWYYRKPQQRYLRRLWPELVPVAAPAQPATAPTA